MSSLSIVDVVDDKQLLVAQLIDHVEFIESSYLVYVNLGSVATMAFCVQNFLLICILDCESFPRKHSL